MKLRISDILYIEGLGDYLKIFVQNSKPVITRMTMKTITEKLPAREFVRVHRSFIVPFSRIRQVRNKVIFIDSKEIPIGSSYEEEFFKRFSA